MRLDQGLVDAAISLAEKRWSEGEGGAAAMFVEDGRALTSVFTESPNGAAEPCHETGAMCEAHKLNLAVTASVSRETERDPFVLLTPCGTCQEPLAFWGREGEVAVPDPEDPTKWQAKLSYEVQPYYLRNIFDRADLRTNHAKNGRRHEERNPEASTGRRSPPHVTRDPHGGDQALRRVVGVGREEIVVPELCFSHGDQENPPMLSHPTRLRCLYVQNHRQRRKT